MLDADIGFRLPATSLKPICIQRVMLGLFRNFAKVCEQVAATPRRNEKVERVAAYLYTLEAAEAGLAARYVGGNAFAAWESELAAS
jgi:hypothetical protein